MNELTSKVKSRPINPDKPDPALNALLGLLNDPSVTGAMVPKPGQEAPPAEAMPSAPAPAPVVAAAPATPAAKANIDSRRIFFTGLIGVGKDFCAKEAGSTILGFADPLYYLQNRFFGSQNKKLPGARAFLQSIGQWGRGEVNDRYPLTVERAVFISMIRAIAKNLSTEFSVEWEKFGTSQDLWVDACITRAMALLKSGRPRVAITNVRFSNEHKRLYSSGWGHFHVTCSPATHAKRLAEMGLKPESPEMRDTSEQLAVALNNDVMRKLSAARTGPMLRVIWNDENVSPPSPRLFTVESFVRQLEIESLPV